jgi:O-antigen ligase
MFICYIITENFQQGEHIMSKKLANRIHKKQKVADKSLIENKLLYPILFIIGVLPLIIRVHIYDPKLSSFAWYPDSTSAVDVFLYYKYIFFLIACTVMLIISIYKVLQNRELRRTKPMFAALFVYAFLALVSSVLSKYPYFSFNGITDQFESVFTLIGYALIVFYGYLVIDKEQDVKILLKVLTLSILIISILGLTQITGHDFFATEFGLKTFVPSNMWNQLDSFNFTFGPKMVYLTLYNPNYVGVYAALLFPILLSLLLVSKSKVNTLFLAFAALGLLISLIGSKSDAGIIGIAASLLFIVIFFRHYIFKKWVFVIPIVIGSFLLVLTGKINVSTLTTLLERLEPQKTEYNLTDIKTEENIIITYKKNDLLITYDGAIDTGINIQLSDTNRAEIPYTVNAENGTFTILDERFSNITITPVNYNNLLAINLKIDGIDWVFTNQLSDGSYYYINQNGKPDKIITAESSIFTGYESYASKRGYIWSRTIPLLKDHLILGSGADTYAIVFPQQDYVYLRNVGFTGMVLTKPHSMYLQMGVQTGALSLICFLVFYGIYFITSIRLYLKGKFESDFAKAGIAIFIGTIGYMVVGISNDSSIAVAPVFWALIGIGIACNHHVKKDKLDLNQ